MRVYSVSEAAGILNVCEATILKKIYNGTFKGCYKASAGFPGSVPWHIPADNIDSYSSAKQKKTEKYQRHIRGSKKMETKRIMAALDEMDEAIMQLHDAISRLRLELG